IFTTSKYAIHAICYLADTNHTRGWGCENSDLLERITDLIHQQTGQISFFWV
ncbi:hypothetical protein B0H10DRAFT_1671599, partial [Mycena sp. CBHHK59/15]